MTFCNIDTPKGRNLTKVLRDILADEGDVDRLARAIVSAADNGGSVDAIIRQTSRPGFRAIAEEYWINNILSGPFTHVVNITGNALTAFELVGERALASGIRAVSPGKGVARGEAAAQFYGLMEGVRDGFVALSKAARKGQRQTGEGFADAFERLTEANLDPLTKIEGSRYHAISAANLNLSESGLLGKSVDVAGSVVRIPGTFLGHQDSFFKLIGRRMELRALAYRTATDEGLTGRKLAARMAEILTDPPQALLEQAVTAAQYQTFTKALGPSGQKMQRAINGTPFAKFIVPFIRTPVNILKFAGERTILAPLAPSVRAEIMAGGARRDIALAKITMGSLIMGSTMGLVMTGRVSGGGPTDKYQAQAMRRQGWQPYSVKIGNKWINYQRTDPVGMTIGLAADMAQILNLTPDQVAMDQATLDRARKDLIASGRSEAEANEVISRLAEAGSIGATELIAGVIMAVGNNVVNKTYMSGVGDFMAIFTAPGEGLRAFEAESYFENLMSGFLPFSSAVRQTERMVDPQLRYAEGLLQAYKSMIPGLSSDLPPIRDLWGRERDHYTTYSPFAFSEEKPNAADTELLRLGVGKAMPQKSFKVGDTSVPLSMDEYSEYVRLSGNGWKDPDTGLGLMDSIEALATGKHPDGKLQRSYTRGTDGPEGDKALIIDRLFRDYRKAAKAELLRTHPTLRETVRIRGEYRATLRK